MNLISKIIILFLFFISFNSIALSKTVFIDVDKIINESKKGKKVNEELNSLYKKENEKLMQAKKEIEKKEEDITKQKNILSEEELNKKINELRTIINDHNKKKRTIDTKFRDQKINQTNILVQNLNKILAQYAEENSIDFILQKKNIVIGKSDLDITNQIMEIFNKQVK